MIKNFTKAEKSGRDCSVIWALWEHDLTHLMSTMTSFADPLAHVTSQLSGYRFSDIVYQGTRTTVYRAVEKATQRLVIIKMLSQEHPSFTDLIQFRNQYTITQNLAVEGIIRPLDLVSCGNGYSLIMEDFGGIDLACYARQSPLSLTEILDIAIQLSTILHDLHQYRVIHKDLKPANILIHPDSKQVKLIDFSIASQLPKETQTLQSPQTLEGTLAYLAPEQTGRMNRAIDYRTDYYTLGVTLYQLLTGQLPFTNSDPLKLIHCHIAQMPVAVNEVNPEVPAIVAAIIAKLMAKNAEDRYQSALGIKHDFEQCLTQRQAQNDIMTFELGRRDICEHFVIPEKIYGREAEIQTLLNAFDRVANGQAEMVLVAGSSGIGKTAIVNEVHKPITRQQGYFIKGKFDQFNRDIPFSAIVQAFRELMGQLLSESDEALTVWKQKILSAVGENGRILTEVIPELEQIIGVQSTVLESSEVAAQTRFKVLFQKFISVFAAVDHPLVIFLDDLQWADSASLNLISILMGDRSGHLLLMGAYRDNEIFPAHPLMMMLAELEKSKALVSTISLAALPPEQINLWVSETLNCHLGMAESLADFLYQKAKGNPFFTAQYLRGLHEDGLIFFDQNAAHWQYEVAKIQAAALTDDVVDFMSERLQSLSATTQETLKFAACLGNQFELDMLAVVCDRSQESVAADLWSAMQNSLILPENQTYKLFQLKKADIYDGESAKPINTHYRFLHDRVQQAAYNLIQIDQRQTTHLAIGRLLLQSTSELAANPFEVVNHWNLAIDLVTDIDEKVNLAHLNLQAGCKAKASGAYEPALKYLNTGLDLLGKNAWQTHYDLILKLYKEAAKVALICGDYLQMEQWSETVLQHSQTVLDKVEMYDVQIQAQMAQAKPTIAIQIAFVALELLDISLPDAPSPADIQHELAITQALWSQRDIAELINLPTMTNPEMLAAIIILSSIFAPSFIAKPDILPLIACKQIQLSIQYGNCEHSAFGYSNYSAILNTLCGDLDASYRFGRLAIDLVEKFNYKSVKARTFNQAAIFSMHGKVHVREAPSILQEGCQSGIEHGDLEFAGYAAYNWSQYSYFSGLPLTDLQKGAETYGLLLSQANQQISLSCNQVVQQAALNLLGESEDPCQLTGTIFNEAAALKQFSENQVFSGIQYLFLHKIILCFLMSKFDHIEAYIEQSEKNLSASTGMITVPGFYFYATLSRLQLYASKSGPEQSELLTQIDGGIAEMRRWAQQAPMNFQHKYDLLMAEYNRIMGERYVAADFYDQAIAGAHANEYGQEAAIANELAAQFYLAWGREKIAAHYIQEAYYCYARWGAKAKVTDLETRYSEMLRPILQPLASSRDVVNALMTLNNSRTPTHSGKQSSFTSANLNQTLDFASILKASQALSNTIHLEELLGQLTQIILQNSGGDRCALMFPNRDGEWQVRAITTLEDTQLCNAPLADNPDLPVQLIRYVKNTQEAVVIDDLDTDLRVIDTYLQQQQPKSVLCLPLLNQGKFIGIVYLQNSLTSGVFTEERLLVLNFLCTQAAISLENARLYEEIQQSLVNLQQAQLQLVQSEKMSALGGLIAGVAHEINNPVGCIIGNVEAAQDYIDDLLGLLTLYGEQFPEPGPDITAELEAIELDYVREDLPQLIRAMKDSGDRIKSISHSLRTFSRADTDSKQRFDLHEGIESTVLILRHRLKANSHRPAIEVITDYGDLPPISCFPGQLNQVFMNLLANAIDSLDEASQDATRAETNPSQYITIRTEADDTGVLIAIADNGPGIADDIKTQIFDHLFTTKGVGKGTGLGLAIAHQIVVETHGGSIEVHSEIGQGAEFRIYLPV